MIKRLAILKNACYKPHGAHKYEGTYFSLQCYEILVQPDDLVRR